MRFCNLKHVYDTWKTETILTIIYLVKKQRRVDGLTAKNEYIMYQNSKSHVKSMRFRLKFLMDKNRKINLGSLVGDWSI